MADAAVAFGPLGTMKKLHKADVLEILERLLNFKYKSGGNIIMNEYDLNEMRNEQGVYVNVETTNKFLRKVF